MNHRTATIQADQITSAFINQINNNRFNSFQEAILVVEKELGSKLAEQDIRMLESLSHLQVVRDFIGNPDAILGSMSTKHGEIAEQVEVGIRNARDALKGIDIKATFEGVGRTAPEDYRIGDILYQSKFINGSRNTLDHVLEHMKKYDDFKLGDNTKYHIPKDQYELIKKVINGEEVDRLNSKSIIALKDKISELEKITGKNFFDKVEPGDSSYAEVQIGKVSDTLNNHENQLSSENEKIKDAFKDEAKEKAKSLEYIKEPTLGEALKAGAIGAGVSATIKFGFNVYNKYKNENKRIYEYTQEDWTEIGIDVSKGALRGGISGTAIYALTNYVMMPAPVAGGYVSATYSALELVNKYKQGKIEIEDLLVESEAVCVEAGLAMSCALIGQAVIPIPILGAIVGSVVGSVVAGPIMNKIETHLSEEEEKLLKEYHERYKDFVMTLEKDEMAYYNEVMMYFKKLDDIETFIFDYNFNSTIRLIKSAELANQLGVDSKLILNNINDVDALFM